MMKLLAVALSLLLSLPATAQEVTGRFTLDDHDGRRVTEQSYEGKVRMMSFGYTFCPDVCPTTLSTMASALDLLGGEATRVAPLFVTLDPKRDTPEHLKEYMAAFGPTFVGLTGSREMVADAAFNFQARYRLHKPKETGAYFIDHTASIYLMDRHGRLAAKLAHNTAPAELADAVRKALRD